MCGIAAIISKSSKNLLYSRSVLDNVIKAVLHRGPDDLGILCFDRNLNIQSERDDNSNFFIGLGHTRLSIIDLTNAGLQPMSICNGDYTITYNGEIYNYLELRKELEKEGFNFKSHCDTEVLLASYVHWGTECLKKMNGMWSFIILDKKKRELFISRDRTGIKPLYVWENERQISFVSEIKQFFQIPDFKKRVNIGNLMLYLITGYENNSSTFYDEVFIFPPASYAVVSVDSPSLKIQKYWDIPLPSYTDITENDLMYEIKEKFNDAIKLHLRADLQVGVCLSGGLDSSSILVHMYKNSPTNLIHAFSICFNDFEYNEKKFMDILLRDYRINHICIFPNENHLANEFERFLFQHDEPVGSLSVFAQYMLMKAAKREGISVLLDGQGGDELFSGYWNSYILLLYNIWEKNKLLFLKCLAECFAFSANKQIFIETIKSFEEFHKRFYLKSLPFNPLKEYFENLSHQYLLQWHIKAQELSPFEYRKAEIQNIHLPRLLKWEDRNSMAFSIESRLPFLDLELLNLVLSLPPRLNMKKGWTKYMLRLAMNESLPPQICWRRDKIGFDVPQKKWMSKGAFYSKLLDWTLEKEHPVLDYVETDFENIRISLQKEDFEPNFMFRLFCADKWLKFL